MRRDLGFSLIEMVVATALTAAVAASVLAMVHPAHGAFDTGLEMADMQQRVRVVADTITRDLTTAGAGAYVGQHRGPLLHYFAPVLPFRRSMAREDEPGTFRTDVVTLISVPVTAAQATLASDLLASDRSLHTAPQAGCPAATILCGFADGMMVVLYDAAGSLDLLRIAAVDEAAALLTVTARPAASAGTFYRRGSTIAEAEIDTYYLKADPTLHTSQLMHADGSGNPDVPVVDHVVGLAFEYEGEPRPPSLAATGDASYGPTPPPVGTATTAYPAGENCAFRIEETSGLPVSRLPSLGVGSALVPLLASDLVDGPWCPDERHSNRWDADLLRVRRVGVTIRVEAALAALRGPAGMLFANAGSSRGGNRWAPDQVIRFHISPRNLNLEPQ